MNTKCVCCAAAGAAGRMSYTVFLHSNVLFLRSNVVSLRSSVSSLLTSVLSLQRSVLQRKMLRRQKLLSTIEQCVLFLRGDKTRMAGDQGESCTVSVHVRTWSQWQKPKRRIQAQCTMTSGLGAGDPLGTNDPQRTITSGQGAKCGCSCAAAQSDPRSQHSTTKSNRAVWQLCRYTENNSAVPQAP